jgi:hypothetical protein
MEKKIIPALLASTLLVSACPKPAVEPQGVKTMFGTYEPNMAGTDRPLEEDKPFEGRHPAIQGGLDQIYDQERVRELRWLRSTWYWMMEDFASGEETSLVDAMHEKRTGLFLFLGSLLKQSMFRLQDVNCWKSNDGRFVMCGGIREGDLLENFARPDLFEIEEQRANAVLADFCLYPDACEYGFKVEPLSDGGQRGKFVVACDVEAVNVLIADLDEGETLDCSDPDLELYLDDIPDRRTPVIE